MVAWHCRGETLSIGPLRWLNTTPQIASSKLNRRIVNQETIYLHRSSVAAAKQFT